PDRRRDRSRSTRPRGPGEDDAARGGDTRGQRRDAPPDPLVDAAGAEGGDDLSILDLADEAVGQDALEAVADQDAELAVTRGDEEDDARVLSLSPGLPRVRDPHRVGEVVEGRRRVDRDDGDLRARLVAQLLVQPFDP